MTSSDIRKKFIDFFKARGHKEIASAPLVPENDPTTLFISAGMQSLIQYILGEPHPLGRRLVNSQKCFRSQDIEEVGDTSHTTFFEMLGNWSLGDYFKKEQLPWVFEFFTGELGLDPEKLYVTVFEGNGSVPKDTESIEIWKELFAGVGIDADVEEPHSVTYNPTSPSATRGTRIFTYDARKNWWSRSGEPDTMPPGEPGGPDSEIFYDFGSESGLHEKSPYKNKKCHPNCLCGRFIEIGNSVFMQYQKQSDGILKELKQKSVDFGGGLERLNAAVNNRQDIFLTDSLHSIIQVIEKISGKQYGTDIQTTKAMRIIADHMRGAVMMIADGVTPGNKTQGYFLRRLIRRSLLYGKAIGLWGNWEYMGQFAEPVSTTFLDAYPEVKKQETAIKETIVDEANRFGKTIGKGLHEIEKIETIDGKQAFFFYETYGFPWELTEEITGGKGQTIDRKQFEEEFRKHQELSRSAAAGMFKGGLENGSVQTTKLHTATHLLHQALHLVLGNHVAQKGSNITVERLRFDFSHPQKVTDKELKKAEAIVNEKIQENLPVTFEEMDKSEALKSGALGFFAQKYGDRVKVYSIGDFSKEICGGPHVGFTGELGHFTIRKEESAASGIRRIYAKVDGHETV